MDTPPALHNGLLLAGVGDDIVADGLRLCVQLHDALVEDLVLRADISHFLLHASRLLLSLHQRVLEHDLLLLELLFLGLELCHAGRQELNLLLPLVELVMKLFRLILLFPRFVADAADLRLNLENLIITLVNELLDRLKGLVTLLHAKQTLLPVL